MPNFEPGERLDVVVHIGQVLALAWAMSDEAPGLSDRQRFVWSTYIVVESRRNGLDPFLVLAVAVRESGLRHRARNRTDDHGLLQVHWSDDAGWLRGLDRDDLLDPMKNIRAGTAELAFWRSYCGRHGMSHGAGWVGHYKWGVRPDLGYARRVNVVYRRMTGTDYGP